MGRRSSITPGRGSPARACGPRRGFETPAGFGRSWSLDFASSFPHWCTEARRERGTHARMRFSSPCHFLALPCKVGPAVAGVKDDATTAQPVIRVHEGHAEEERPQLAGPGRAAVHGSKDVGSEVHKITTP